MKAQMMSTLKHSSELPDSPSHPFKAVARVQIPLGPHIKFPCQQRLCCLASAALNALTRILAAEVRGNDILVNR
jgi:hypothetical protein